MVYAQFDSPVDATGHALFRRLIGWFGLMNEEDKHAIGEMW